MNHSQPRWQTIHSGEDNDSIDDERRKREMPADRYTKFILTLIAISLTVIALRPFFSPSSVEAEMNGCGLDARHPCYIAGWGPEGTVPIASSSHFPLKALVGNTAENPVPVVVVNRPMPF
jgi:hypothetical protein